MKAKKKKKIGGHLGDLVFYRGGKRINKQRTHSVENVKLFFSVPLSNRFGRLGRSMDTPSRETSYKKTSSVNDQTYKKQRSKTDQDSDTSQMNVSFKSKDNALSNNSCVILITAALN